MAEFNIVPDVRLMAIQASLFLANLYVCKKLFVEPFLKLSAARDSLTVSSKSAALQLREQNETASLSLNERLASASDAMKEDREKILASARSKREALVAEARDNASSALELFSQELELIAVEERKKLKVLSEEIAAEMYANVTRC